MHDRERAAGVPDRVGDASRPPASTTTSEVHCAIGVAPASETRDLRLRERRRVVDAVAHHRDHRAGALQRRDRRRASRPDGGRRAPRECRRPGERGRGRLAVAGEHRRRDAERGEAGDRLSARPRAARRPARTPRRTRPRRRAPRRSRARRPPARKASSSGGAAPAIAATKSVRPRRQRRPPTVPATPCPDTCDRSPRAGTSGPRARKRSLARSGARARLERRGDREHVGRRPVAKRTRRGQPHAPLGQRSGLVERDVRDARERFQRVGPREHDAAPSERARRGGDRRRRRERQRARARDHEQREGHRQHARRVDREPGDRGHRRQREQARDEDRRARDRRASRRAGAPTRRDRPSASPRPARSRRRPR